MERRQLPLNAEGFHLFHRAAREQDDPAKRLVGLGLLHLGLRNQTISHMKEDWLEDGPNGLQVRVPRQEECYKFGGCCHCQGEENNAPDGYWSPKTPTSARVVPVPSHFENHHTGEREETGLHSLLRNFYELEEAIGVGRQTILRWVGEIGLDGGIHEIQSRGLVTKMAGDGEKMYPDLVAHDLRGSWACQCVRSDVNRFRIRDWGGWRDVSTLNKYVRFVGGGDGSERQKY